MIFYVIFIFYVRLIVGCGSAGWEVTTPSFGRYLWLPLLVDASAPFLNGTVSVTNPASWRYDQAVALK